MKFIKNKAFPYPVLSEYSDDYVDRAFQVAIIFKINPETYAPSLQVQCTLSDEHLDHLIRSDKAKFVIETYCPITFLRRVDHSNQNKFEINLKRGDIHQKVEINAFIVCTGRVDSFCSKNFNLEFGENSTFELNPGDVLAVQSPKYYWWDTEQIRPIGTVFELVENNSVKAGTFKVLWEKQKIQIMMREKEKIHFEIARNMKAMKPTLLMSVYFPTLMESLRIMSESDGEHEEKKWFQAIQFKLNEQKIQLSRDMDFLYTAQKLLGMPLDKVLSEMGK